MMPSLDEKYHIEIEVISKPKKQYSTDAYLKTGLPAAPAIMIDNEVIVKGLDIPEYQKKPGRHHS